MRLVIEREDFWRALSITQNIVERKTSMPILVNVLLSATDGKLRVSATDLEVTAHVAVDATITSPGSTTVLARMLSEIVRELPSGKIEISVTEGERIEITSGGSNLKLIGVSAEEYPSLPGLSIKPESKISSVKLAEMITRTIYAVSKDETRFNLNGVCFESHKIGSGKNTTHELRLVATDGHRLAYISREVEGALIGEGSSVVVPSKGLIELKKLLDLSEGEEIAVGIQEGFLVAESGIGKISVRLIDGDFPDYHQVMPKKAGVVAVIPLNDLSHALKRASLMVSEKGKGIRMEFLQGKLRISSSSPEIGDSVEDLEIKYSGAQTSLGFNARYLLDFCSSLSEATEINVEINGELGPVKLSVPGDDSCFGIVMPMRIS